MTKLLTSAAYRGIASVRADISDPNAALAELNKAFAEFKETNDANLKKRDVVLDEKVDRINAAMTDMEAKLKEIQATAAASGLGGGGNEANQAKEEYRKAFNSWFRKGVDNDLNALAAKAALRTDSDPDGGYLVPEEMASTVDRVATTVSAMRSVATVMSMSAGVYKKPITTGGAASGWVGERESRTETNTPTLSVLEFPAMELYANPAATQTMLDDAAFDIGAWLGSEVNIVFAEQEGAAFITGNGVNKPRGILAYDTIADASWTWGKLGFTISGVAAALSDNSNNGVDALIGTAYSLKQVYRPNASWMMNRTTAAVTRKLKDDYGQYLWQPATQVGQPSTLLGYPVVDDDNMSDIGANAFPIAFGDFRRGYLIVDRVGIRVLRDPYSNKPYVHFYTTKRVGGGVQHFEAIKLLKISA